MQGTVCTELEPEIDDIMGAHTGRLPRVIHHWRSCAVPAGTHVLNRMPMHAGGAAEHGRHCDWASAAGPDAAGQRPVARLHRRGHLEHRDCHLCAGAPCIFHTKHYIVCMPSEHQDVLPVLHASLPVAPGPRACRSAAVRKSVACDVYILCLL